MNETIMLHEGFITTKEASKLFRYTPSYIAHLVRTKKINAQRLGRSWLIEQNSLQHFVAQYDKQNSNKTRTSTNANTTRSRAQEQRTYHAPPSISLSFSSAEPHTITTHQIVSDDLKTPPSIWIEIVCAVMFIVSVVIAAEFITIAVQSNPVFLQSVGTLQTLPAIIGRTSLALGEFVITATHAAIAAEVSLAYGIAIATPTIAHVTVGTLTSIGDYLSIAVARIPMQMASVFAHGTQ